MTAATPERGPLRPARRPTGAGAIGWVGPLLAVLVIGLGVVLGQDALSRTRGGGASWIASATTGLDGLAPAAWMAAAGVVLVLVGLWLIVTMARPRTRDTLALDGAPAVHLGTSDIARLASERAGEVDGVLSARSTATRRLVSVRITTTGDPGAAEAVRAAASAALAPLARTPRVRVTARPLGGAA